MSEWIEQREEFYKIAIARGMTEEREIPLAFPLGHNVPPGKMEKWLKKLVAHPKGFSSQRRYVNHFKIGADPEFVFLNSREDSRKDAQALKLKQGPAFGADNNGRLAEIRPHPSRSAVEVCASILSTLRWMALLYPQTLNYSWKAGAWAIEDGLGGHVHFGRKRPNRGAEVVALDQIADTMMDIGMFSREEQDRRRAGDSHRQLYGQRGDYRLQTHGYEYRTFPSWLDSPELAFVTMTLAKLAVHDPGLVWRYTHGEFENARRIGNFLRFYKSSDDDARLALFVLKRGLVRGGDFKMRWGVGPLLGETGVAATLPQFVPLSIKPTEEEVNEMFTSLHEGKPLGMKRPTPTWMPTGLPRNYLPVIDNTQTIQRKGIGELCWDMCYHQAFPIMLMRDQAAGMNHTDIIAVGRHLWRSIPRTRGIHWHGGDEQIVFIFPQALDRGRSSEIRRLLLTGNLPLWRAKDVKPASYLYWKDIIRKDPCQKYAGSWIRKDGQLPGVQEG